jgi:hypothetical protein
VGEKKKDRGKPAFIFLSGSYRPWLSLLLPNGKCLDLPVVVVVVARHA